MNPTSTDSRGVERTRARPLRIAALLTVGLVIAAAVLAGCGSSSGSSSSSAGSTDSGGGSESSSSGESSKHANIAAFLVSTANTHQQAALKGMEKVVEEDGNASLHAFNGNFDPATQVNQIEDATASGQYDALLVNSIDGTQTIPAITKALGEELVVICGFSVCGPEQEKYSKQLPVTAQIASDYSEVGRFGAEAMIKACEEKELDPCNIVYLEGTPTLALDKTYRRGVDETLAEAPQVHLIAEAEGQFLASVANKAMKPIIQAHPDINGVLSLSDQEMSGAQQAIEESSLKNKGVILVGDGASTIAKKAIEEGKWYASSILRPKYEGELEAEYAIAAVRGEPMSPDLVTTVTAPGFPSGYIDKSNASKWTPEWAG